MNNPENSHGGPAARDAAELSGEPVYGASSFEEVIPTESTTTPTPENVSATEIPLNPNSAKKIGAMVKKAGEIMYRIIEKAKYAIDKIKSNYKTAFKVGTAAILIAATAASISACGDGGDSDTSASPENEDDTEAVSMYQGEIPSQQAFEMFDPYEVISGYEGLEPTDDSLEQDENIGCYLGSLTKVSPNSVGNPDEVLQKMGIDPKNATAEQRGKAIEYIGLSMKYPTAAEAIVYAEAGFKEFEDFKGLTNVEAEDKIANMSDEEKVNLCNKIRDKNQNATYRIIRGNNEVYKNQGIVQGKNARHSKFFESRLGNDVEIVEKTIKSDDGTEVTIFYKSDCANILTFVAIQLPSGQKAYIEIRQEEAEEKPTESPKPKDQAEADENSGASAGIVTPEEQGRQITGNPSPDGTHQYNPETNTSNGTPEEQANQIGYETTSGTGGSSDTSGGTAYGTGQANNFDAGASIGTGEVTGNTPSVSGNGTIQENLDNATGNAGADYSEGF